METWQTILLAFGGNAALLAVLGILGKSLLDKLIVRDSKQFENDLKAKSDAAIEHLKNELQVRTIEHQVRFSRLHERRASVIAELYGHLVEALWEAESFLSPMEWAGEPNKNEKHQNAMNKLVELYRHFDKHRIYLPPEVCASLEALIRDVRSQVINFGVWVRYEDHELTGDSHVRKNDAWDSGWKAIKNQVPIARRSLEEEFRTLLGAAANVAVEKGTT
jgi:cation transport regulator ChaB